MNYNDVTNLEEYEMYCREFIVQKFDLNENPMADEELYNIYEEIRTAVEDIVIQTDNEKLTNMVIASPNREDIFSLRVLVNKGDISEGVSVQDMIDWAVVEYLLDAILPD